MSSTGSATPTATALPPPKQIRFVNNEGQPPAKRRRINAACRTCRKRKTRCDGTRPLCSTCTDGGHECLGYEVDDGKETKKGARGSDAKTEIDEEEEKKSILSSGGSENGQRGRVDHLRTESRSYLDASSPRSRDMDSTDNKAKGTASGQWDYRDNAIFSDDAPSPKTRSPPSHPESHRVPYFRYFGPTAIVPGFKQMVVSVRENRRSTGAGSAIGTSPGSGGSVHGAQTPSQSGTEPRSSVETPIYDPADHLPVNRLIIHLVETFFVHLGCNYPFLRQEKFVRMVEEKRVDAILVDAVCALAARFSDHPLLTVSHDSKYPKSEYGHVFAQRAKAAVVDTFPAPSVAAVQACLLLAYEGFGAGQDSTLWMFLGCAIRMAVDLGLQKLDGVKHQGQNDPQNRRASAASDNLYDKASPEEKLAIAEKERIEVEQERVDTLWAVFMLDRVISSGTGRPVTLRDDDFELSFPAVVDKRGGWPNPFPVLIQITHLYGRVSDLLNNIRDVEDVTQQRMEGLSGMERDLTQLYQRLDHRLTFNATNFQHYVKSGEGTNFILVHFWFHTLIMLLHQPTLMHSFEGQILQLLPNSRELSMSSAKTIADILAFAELIDPRSFIGNPFTSQPMYIAACAFLMEQAAHTSSQPTSREVSPPRQAGKSLQKGDGKPTDSKGNQWEQKQKHTLLASAANQNYQRCYKSLQQVETYWAGARYILVALEQKAQGIWDPETYTEQDMEATRLPKADLIPSWRRKLSMAAPSPSSRFADFARSPRQEIPGSPAIDPAQAIGWSLTGTTNSPSSNLTFMYQSMNGSDQPPPQPVGAGNMIYDPIRQSLPEATPSSTSTSTFNNARYQSFPQHRQQMPPPAAPKYTPISSSITSDPVTTSDAEMLLGLQNSPFAQTPTSQHSFDHNPNPNMTSSNTQQQNAVDFTFPGAAGANNGYMYMGGVNDMMMESQEIDMSTLGGDMMPWLEYLPQDVLNFFDGGGGNGNLGSVGSGGAGMNGNVDIGSGMGGG